MSASQMELVVRANLTVPGKKIPFNMCDSSCGWFIVKKLKYFQVMLKMFEFSWVCKKVESALVYAYTLFWIAQPYFSTEIIKDS